MVALGNGEVRVYDDRTVIDTFTITGGSVWGASVIPSLNLLASMRLQISLCAWHKQILTKYLALFIAAVLHHVTCTHLDPADAMVFGQCGPSTTSVLAMVTRKVRGSLWKPSLIVLSAQTRRVCLSRFERVCVVLQGLLIIKTISPDVDFSNAAVQGGPPPEQSIRIPVSPTQCLSEDSCTSMPLTCV